MPEAASDGPDVNAGGEKFRCGVVAQVMQRRIDRGWPRRRTGTWLRGRLAGHPGYHAIQRIPGIGPTLAAVFVAEIGEPARFSTPGHVASWAGLTPRHRESDAKVRRGSITKQGSTLVRWAAIEAAQKIPATAGRLVPSRARITERRGRNIATVAVARKLLTLVYYGLRDGHIRALARPDVA